MENDNENVEAQKPVEKKTKKQEKDNKEFVKNTVEINPDLKEQAGKTVVVGWGRMNPITVGHEKLVNKIQSVAKQNSATPVVYLSQSQDKKKNPLSYNDKIAYAKKAFGSIVKKTTAKTIMQVLAELQKSYKNVILVVGSDRVKQFDDLLAKYNGKDYTFDSIKVVSAGERDPDADDVSGMSASKMRALASQGKPEEFKKGLPRKLQSSSQKLYDLVRAGMQLSEELEAEGLLTEAPLTVAQRMKRGRIMKKYASRIAMARKRKMKRKADLATIKKRARKKAIDVIRKKVAGAQGKSYQEMSASEKSMIDKKVQKRQAAIERIAKRLIPQVRKVEMARIRGKSVNEQFENTFTININEQFENMFENKTYHSGLSKSTAAKRKAHFEKGAKMDDNNPAAYKPAPGDATAKTKESKHTKKYREMYGEEYDTPKKKRFHELLKKDGSVKHDRRFKFNRKMATEQTAEIDRLKDQHKDEKNRMRSSHERELDRAKVRAVRSKTSMANKPIKESFENDEELLQLVKEIHESLQLDESKVKSALQKKAEKSGMPYGVLKKVYDRGVAAWRTGHRPGTTPSQWGFARVNSFVTKSSGTWGKADKDLASQVKGK